ncbi:MAG: hypothetical protein ABH862_03555 [Candidatus Omnitrophota bacterium]
MKQKTYIFTVTGLALLFLLYMNRSSVFGQSSDQEASPVKIIQPVAGEQVEPVSVEVKVVSETRVIRNRIELNFEEEYESDYIDVRDYRNIAFYVLPESGTSSPVPDALYRLDAFFSLENTKETLWEIGSTKAARLSIDWQEFGSMIVKPDGTSEELSFVRLTTGETMSRVLYTNVYGPFVRVVLKNLTPEKKYRFKITAYLTR